MTNSTTPSQSSAATIVMKFGGTSMKDAATIRRSAELARSSAGDTPCVVVVSAMDQVTELLLELADAAAGDNRAAVYALMSQVRSKHEAAARELGGGAPDAVAAQLDRLDRLVTGISAVGELTARSKDAVVAFGERLASSMMAAAMSVEPAGSPTVWRGACRALSGHEAGIVTSEAFGKAEPLMELTFYQLRENLPPILERDRRVVVAGFIAATQHGVTTTLGRGGSDYTACIIGAALRAAEVWLWSDVDGLMTADPRVVPVARPLPEITFPEAIEMGQFGAKSMHPLALEPAAEHAVVVRMRNTFNPAAPGTRIVPEVVGDHAHESASGGAPVRSVQLLKNAAMLTISGAAMIGRPGTAAAVFTALAHAQVNIMMISQSVSEAGISLVVARDQCERARAVLDRSLMRAPSGGSGGGRVARAVTVAEQVNVIACIGAAMHGTPGIAARIFGAVAREGVNVLAIAQGSSELSISLVVSADAAAQAVRALHAEFIG